MNKFYKIIFALFLSITFIAQSQSISQSVISFCGSSMSDGSIYLDQTFGQIENNTLSSGTNSLTQGFLQPLNATMTFIQEKSATVFKVFPNPSSDFITIQVESNKPFESILYDMNGKQLIYTNTNRMDLSELNSGSYMIIIKTEREIFHTQIIKY